MRKRIRRNRKSIEINLPSYWASYLINNDASGMTSLELQQCIKDTKNLGYCAGCNDENFFATYQGMGCDMLTYTFIKN